MSIRSKWLVIVLIILCALIYANSLGNGFVLDDKALVVNNPLGKSLKLMPHVFKQSLYEHWVSVKLYDLMYRPVQLIAYGVVYNIGGLNPFWYHFSSVALHLFNSILVCYFIFLLFADFKISAIAGILFLVHPIHTSVVSYISSSADLLSCLFTLLSLILLLKFLRLNRVWFLSLSLLSGLAALLSRENAIVLFLLSGVVIFTEKREKKFYLLILLYLLLNLSYLILRYCALGVNGLYGHPDQLALPLHLVNFFNIVFRYIQLLLFPLELHPLRTTYMIRSFLGPRIFFALFFILVYTFIIIKMKKNKLIVFSMAWFFIGLLPAFFSLDGYPMLEGSMMAESWLYLPSIGFFAALAFMINSFKKPFVITLLLVAIYGSLTVKNNTYWKNDSRILERTLKYTSRKNVMRKDLIESYLEAGRYPEALREINEFSKYYSHTSLVNVVWGNYYYFAAQPGTAVDYYEKALLKNRNFFLYYRLSSCFKDMRQPGKAIEYGLKSYEANRFFTPNLIQLGGLYGRENQFNEARRYYQMACEIEPKNKEFKGLLNNAK